MIPGRVAAVLLMMIKQQAIERDMTMGVLRLFIVMMLGTLLLTGCGSTWTAKDVGRGMQLGSMGGNGGWLAPVVWGTGFVIEHVGEAVEGKSFVSGHTTPLVEPDASKNVVPASRHID